MKCPCHSQKLYQDCCQPYHQGSLPKKAMELMRSRYAAYALNLGSYIMETTHPHSPHFLSNTEKWLINIDSFAKKTHFENLEILDDQESPEEAYVTFAAGLKQDGKDVSFTEKSHFKKENGKWLYCEGQLVKGFLSAQQAKKL